MMTTGYLEPSEADLASALAGETEWSASLRTLVMRESGIVAEMLEGIPEDGRERLLGEVSGTLIENDPAALLDLSGQFAEAGKYPTMEAQHAMSSLVQFDPERAMEMAGSFEDETARRLAVTTLVSNLILDDPERALTWLVEQRGTGITEERFDGLLTSLARKVPWERERIEEIIGDEGGR